MNVEQDFPLARLTTVRAGGNAELFARPSTEDELVELLAWAAKEGHAVEVVGSGSNLLVADAGVRGLVLKLDGELTDTRAGWYARSVRRWSAPALGSGQGRPLGADRPGVRNQHPRHGRRRGQDERKRVRRRACGRARVGERLWTWWSGAPHARTSLASSTGSRTSSRARSSRERRSRWPMRTPTT